MSVLGFSLRDVKLVVEVRLLPEPSVHEALVETLARCNQAANWVSKVAFEKGEHRKFALQSLVYQQVKADFGLSAQPAIRVLAKIEGSYNTLRANLKAGNYGRPGSKRRRQADLVPARLGAAVR